MFIITFASSWFYLNIYIYLKKYLLRWFRISIILLILETIKLNLLKSMNVVKIYETSNIQLKWNIKISGW